MFKLVNTFLLALFALVVISCEKSDVSPGSPSQTSCADNSVVDILFIGNSYTYVNDLPTTFKTLSCSGGHNVSVVSVAPGGASFATHTGNSATTDAINSRQWDFVILQNQSQRPGFKPADVTSGSLPNAVTLANAILTNNAATQIVYYVTWGRENGDAGNCGYYPLVCTFTGHTQALLAGYTQYKASTGGELANVGAAWEAIVDDGGAPFNSGDLWSGDGSHPDVFGTYLTANVFYATIFNETPVGLDVPANISQSNGAYMQSVAKAIVGIP